MMTNHNAAIACEWENKHTDGRKAKYGPLTDAQLEKKRYRNRAIFSVLIFTAVVTFNLIVQRESYSMLAIISDAFMVPGMMLLGVALLKSAGYIGCFDLFFYTASWFVTTLSKDADSEESRQKRAQSFPDYVKERNLGRIFPREDFVFGGALTAVSAAIAVLRITV